MGKMETNLLEEFLKTIPAMSVEKRVKLFLKTRQAKAAAQKCFDDEKAQYEQIMDVCQNSMLRDADAQGVSGFTTPCGTTYAAEVPKYSIADDAAFYAFVRQLGDLDFFERRISATHVQQYMEQSGGTLPPGLNLFRERVMRVRKASDK
jgi:hypothetical protein